MHNKEIPRNKKHLWNQASERFSEYIKDLKEISSQTNSNPTSSSRQNKHRQKELPWELTPPYRQ